MYKDTAEFNNILYAERNNSKFSSLFCRCVFKWNFILKNIFVNNKVYHVDSFDELIVEGNQSNPKLIFIVLNADEKVHLSFLDKILMAIGLDRMTDVVTIFYDKGNIPIHKKVSSSVNSKVLVFGIPPKKLGLNFSYQQYESVSLDSTKYLFANNLEDIQSDKRKKLALWNILQIMFPKNKEK